MNSCLEPIQKLIKVGSTNNFLKIFLQLRIRRNKQLLKDFFLSNIVLHLSYRVKSSVKAQILKAIHRYKHFFFIHQVNVEYTGICVSCISFHDNAVLVDSQFDGQDSKGHFKNDWYIQYKLTAWWLRWCQCGIHISFKTTCSYDAFRYK